MGEWEKLVPPEENSPLIPDDPKLIRAYRLSTLADRVTVLQRQRDAATAQMRYKTCELDEARRRFEQEQLQHRDCSMNCSVKRAAPYYERCRMQDRVIDQERVKLNALEQKLHAARHRVVELQLGGQAQKPPSETMRSVLSAKYSRMTKFDEMSLHSFELPGAQRSEDDFCSCDSGES